MSELYRCQQNMAHVNETTGIMEYMKTVMDTYNKLRGKQIDRSTTPFWDVVVITTADEEQKKLYELQIKEKLNRNELPKGIPIHVSADPPGPKIGNGGSTLVSLKMLGDIYKTDLYSMRVMLINAGGQCKRMPSTSVLGKIFSPIPSGSHIYQMLDLKLAMYLPFMEKIPPGVLVTCADDIVVYNLGKDDSRDWCFSESGFTAFAHPSSLALGVKHGVYVIKDVDSIDTSCYIQQHECSEVLQKPSEEVMYRKNAVLNGRDLNFPDGFTVDSRIVYTDSAFFFGSDITKKFIDFERVNGPITCEIDAYGDFLQALGPNASVEYTRNISNVTQPTTNLLPTREKIYQLLKGTDISLLVLNSSRYIHIGTTKEYIRHFCLDKKFRQDMNLQKDVFNLWTVEEGNDTLRAIKIPHDSSGCVMHSILPNDSVISEKSVVEFCHFDIPVITGSNTIMSNCQYVSSENGISASGDSSKTAVRHHLLKIPSNLFVHTVPINIEGTTKFVTIIFHINDDLKKKETSIKMKSLPFLGKTMETFCSSLDLEPSRVLPQRIDCNDEIDVSLWDLALFPAADTMSESLSKSLDIHSAITDGRQISSLKECDIFSMDAILRLKNVKKMLEIRNDLFNKINNTIGSFLF